MFLAMPRFGGPSEARAVAIAPANDCRKNSIQECPNLRTRRAALRQRQLRAYNRSATHPASPRPSRDCRGLLVDLSHTRKAAL